MIHRAGARSRLRRGMTLVEVLVAMTVLLVGIWGVARGFPLLMRTVREEGRRGQMTQLARATMETLLADPTGLPQWVSGGPNVSPQMVPLDPDAFTGVDNPPNSRDDILQVIGERAVIPSVAPGVSVGAVAVYPLKLGRANPTVPPAVAEVRPLTALLSAPPGGMPTGCFHLAGDGTLTADPAVRRMEISYAWLDTATPPAVHWVQREPVTISAGITTVAAAGPGNAANFDRIVEGSVWGNALVDFGVLAAGSTPSPGQAALDATGATLRFNTQNSGRAVQINYSLQAEEPTYGRRAREVFEDQVLSEAVATPDPTDAAFSYVTVQLTAPGVEGESVLNTDPATLDTHVLAVDLATGMRYWEGGADLAGGGIDPALGIDYDRGRVTLRVPSGAGTSPNPYARALGHTFRFFYKTVDQGMITVLRAPEYYLPADLFGAIYPERQYAIVAANPGGYTVLDFTTGLDPVTTQPVSASAGQTVAVDYTYGNANNPQRVLGELHTININERKITLNHPNVQSVIAVRGVSLKVRAWWRAQTGRLQYVDVDNLVVPTAAG